MFPARYFPNRYFAGHYWAHAGSSAVPAAGAVEASLELYRDGVPGWFVIGDDLAFKLDDVTLASDGATPVPSAEVTYELVDSWTRVVVTSGSMQLYDSVAASFNASIASSFLGEYNPATNVNGIHPRRNYALRATVDNGGTKTTFAEMLAALYEPPLP